MHLTELHLLQYHKKHREYVEAEVKSREGRLFQRAAKPFSAPDDPHGYNDSSFTGAVLTNLYEDFVRKTRQAESEAYLRTLHGTDALIFQVTLRVTDYSLWYSPGSIC